jgi:hypothetical protein
MTKEERRYFYRSFAAGVRKPTTVERKMKRKKKVQQAFTHLMLCTTS